MKRSIIITDLTRFKPDNPDVCIAGIDRVTGECIRPMPYLKLQICLELGIRPGGVLTGEFTPKPDRTAPHMEDYHCNGLTYEKPNSIPEFRNVLAQSCSPSIDVVIFPLFH